MNLHLPKGTMCRNKSLRSVSKKDFFTSAKPWFLSSRNTIFYFLLFTFYAFNANAQGSWTPIATVAPDANLGVMLLLSDGSVICKSSGGGTDGIGNTWDRLTPDSKGSYVNGTWSRIKTMINTRLYFSSQVLKDGRVYVAGGEYGTGGSSSEVYDPKTNIWTANPAPGGFISDANSAILENGNLVQAIVQGNPFLRQNKIYNTASATYSAAPSCIGYHNESTWVKLPDNSILMVDRDTRNSERYIPALNQWIADGTLPVDLYDIYGSETGAGLLLPNGKAFFIGATGHTAYYTPSGNNNSGTWVAGPDLPGGNGQADAPAAMMVNGKILLSAAPKPSATGGVFRTPTTFYVFDYRMNKYTQVSTPGGAISANVPVYVTMMLNLPDGSIMCGYQDTSRYYVFKPTGTLPAAAKPVISKVTKNTGPSYTITGTLFNGISEGACYGDDWQMSTNYPIVRLIDGSNNNVYYASTYNWNSTGVRRAGLKDTSQFILPAGLPQKTYSLYVVANGIASLPVSFTPGFVAETSDIIASSAKQAVSSISSVSISPNPANGFTALHFSVSKSSMATVKVFDLNGREVNTVLNENISAGEQSIRINTSNYASGTYIVKIITEEGTQNVKLIVQ